MNLPNKLTLARIAIVPFFVAALLLSENSPAFRIIAFVLFLAACITDTLDGNIARARNLITDFGKLLDPIADKLLVSSAIICFVQLGSLPAWIAIIIIARDFIISGFRLLAADKGVVIAASVLGKAKTVAQMIMIGLLIFNQPHLSFLNNLFIVIVLILTVVSLVDVIRKNLYILKDNTVSEDEFEDSEQSGN